MNEKQFTENLLRLNKLVKRLFGAFPQIKTDDNNIAVYVGKLAKCNPPDLEQAIDYIIDNGNFPNISDIFDVIKGITNKRLQQQERKKQDVQSWQKEPSTEVQAYLQALNLNIATRKAKESSLLKRKELARASNNVTELAEIEVLLAETRDDHQMIADFVQQEFTEGKEISYLKEHYSQKLTKDFQESTTIPLKFLKVLRPGKDNVCEACFGSGWQRVYKRANNSEARITSMGVMPCSCIDGLKFHKPYSLATGVEHDRTS